MKEIQLIRYRTMNACLASFFDCKPSEVKKIKGHWEWMNADGSLESMGPEEWYPTIHKKNAWGWVQDKKILHYFVRKKVSWEDLVSFFAHELGHFERPYHQSLKEEQKANKYSQVARQAFAMALKIKGHFP